MFNRIEVNEVKIYVFYDRASKTYEIDFEEEDDKLFIENLTKQELQKLKQQIEKCLEEYKGD